MGIEIPGDDVVATDERANRCPSRRSDGRADADWIHQGPRLLCAELVNAFRSQ